MRVRTPEKWIPASFLHRVNLSILESIVMDEEEVKLTTPAVRYEGAEVQNVTYDTKTSFMLQDEDLQP